MANKPTAGRSRRPAAKNKNTALKGHTIKPPSKRENYVSKIVPKTISRTRSDISTLQLALQQCDNIDTPKRIRLHNLYKDLLRCAHLTSQIELRTLPVLATPFVLKTVTGDIDEATTETLMAASFVTKLNRGALSPIYHGPGLIEFDFDSLGRLQVKLIPRTNLVPEKGILLLDQNDTSGIKYREVREYGTWLLEFGDPEELGLLHKAAPHVLFMRFAQSCWSELCEIYGIPPRYIKTDTTDPAMLDRAEAMLRDMGAAAYFIIDTTEEFQFAKGAETNGDVYKNLMGVCKEALSILINSAQVGQDTLNGNRSKEESSMLLLDEAVAADRELLAGYWNEQIIPALIRIGVIPPNIVKFEFKQVEDLDALFSKICQLLPYKNIPGEWIEDKFGIPTTDRQTGFNMYGPANATAELTSLLNKAAGQLPKKKAAELRTALGKFIAAHNAEQQGGRDFFA